MELVLNKRTKYNQLGMKRADRGRDICKPRQLYVVITARKLVLYPLSLVVSPAQGLTMTGEMRTLVDGRYQYQ